MTRSAAAALAASSALALLSCGGAAPKPKATSGAPSASAAGARAVPVDASDACSLAWLDTPLWTASDPVLGPRDAKITVLWADDPAWPTGVETVEVLLRDEPDVRVLFRPQADGAGARRAMAAVTHAAKVRGELFLLHALRKIQDSRGVAQGDPDLPEILRGLGAPLDAAALDRAAEAVPAAAPFGKPFGALRAPFFLVNGIAVRTAKAADLRDAVRTARLTARVSERCRAFQVRFPEKPRPLDAPPPAARTADTTEDERTIFKVPPHDAPGQGATEPLVVVVQFGGYQDPFSRRAHGTLESLVADGTKDVRVVYRDMPLPFHKDAVPAAILARLAFLRGGLPTFLAVHRELMLHGRVDKASLEALAKRHGITAQELEAAKADKELLDAVERDRSLGASLGVSGTPTFFINGRRLVGAQPKERFDAVIAEELERAAALLASGVPREDVPEAAVRAGVVPGPKK